jgi:16S rRNA (guanine(966)-N(2))-methyltransferase RsmD
MRAQIRIVAGTLRGRKLVCNVHEGLRPTPQMVREALFSILGNAVPERPFFDVFAGTGAVGLEALSRGASSVVFIERDFRLAGDIDRHLQAFNMADKARVLKTDAYRWANLWQPPGEPVNVFVSPPFQDFQRHLDEFLLLVAQLQKKIAAGSVLVLQAEKHSPLDTMPEREQWELRRYGRNELLLWVKEQSAVGNETPL